MKSPQEDLKPLEMYDDRNKDHYLLAERIGNKLYNSRLWGLNCISIQEKPLTSLEIGELLNYYLKNGSDGTFYFDQVEIDRIIEFMDIDNPISSRKFMAAIEAEMRKNEEMPLNW